MVARRVIEAVKLIAAAREHAAELAQSLRPILAGREGFEGAQIEAMILSQADYLEDMTTQMRRSEQEYINEQDDDITLRGRMAEASIDLDRKLRLTREHIRGAESSSALQLYGLTEAPPRARQALVNYTRNAIELLSARPYTFTGELGESLETRKVALLLHELLDPFAQLVGKMDTEMSELQQALQTRNRAIDEWVEAYCGVGRSLEGLCQLAGERELAEKFSPNFKRVTGSLNLDEITSPKGDEPSRDAEPPARSVLADLLEES